MHIRLGILVLCLKLKEKQLVDQLLCIERMYSSQKKHSKVDFLCSVPFYGHLNRLCDFITFFWLTMWLIVLGCGIPLGIFIDGFQVLYCIADKFPNPCHVL